MRLLPHVENGTFVLIGATTENPYFEVIGALVSRSRVFQLLPLTAEQTGKILDTALADKERGYGAAPGTPGPGCPPHLIDVSNGDARNALNALELAVESTPPDADGVIHITLEVAQESIQRRAVLIRQGRRRPLRHHQRLHQVGARLRPGCGPVLAGQDALRRRRPALHPAPPDHPGRRRYWPGRPDGTGGGVIGPAGLYFIGLPEGVYPIVEATLYLATAPKSNTATSYFKAFERIEQAGVGDVPDHLQDDNRDAVALGHGKGYVYPHMYEEHFFRAAISPQGTAGHVLL